MDVNFGFITAAEKNSSMPKAPLDKIMSLGYFA